jgi:hypothetical protein
MSAFETILEIWRTAALAHPPTRRPIAHVGLRKGLEHFEAALQRLLVPEDGALTARVIGEFSAGKTRLLRELLGDTVPEPLLPTSSLEPQTRLQLEITYGATATLTLVKRAHDTDDSSEPLDNFQIFPDRHELTAFEPSTHRLRLTVPEERFVLPRGDGYYEDDSPKRLFLIDTPGWNSEDDEIDAGSPGSFTTGDHNLALIYVTHANRLDSQVNLDRLSKFLKLMGKECSFVGCHSLIFVITHSESTEEELTRQRAQQKIMQSWKSHHGDRELQLRVFCVDFQGMSTALKTAFRAAFWDALLMPVRMSPGGVAGCESGSATSVDWRQSILNQHLRSWPLQHALRSAHLMLQSARTIIARAVKDGSFLAGMNHARLRDFSQQEI